MGRGDRSPAATGSVAAVGEFGLVADITARFAQGEDVVLGPGDDAAAVTVAGGLAVVSVDVLAEDQHFRLDWSSAADIGHKSAAESMSDINAMGGRPTALVVGLAMPGATSRDWVLELADGLAAEAALAGASVVGGDVVEAERIVISVTSMGVCAHGHPLRRSGARPGQVLAMAGRQGWAQAGYAVLSRGFRSPRAVVEAHRRPEPPYGAGEAAARAGATAMIDVSDGLLQDIAHLASASGVAIDIESDCLDVPEPVRAVGAALGIDPLRLVLTGGEDYGLVATFPADAALPSGWRRIGTVADAAVRGHDGPTGVGNGQVSVDGADFPDPAGHQHFA